MCREPDVLIVDFSQSKSFAENLTHKAAAINDGLLKETIRSFVYHDMTFEQVYQTSDDLVSM